MSSQRPMSDAHIHAFVDRQLKHDREERLQELVSAWPEKYEQIQEYHVINQRLAEGLIDVYDQPIPKSLAKLLNGKKPAVRANVRKSPKIIRKPNPRDPTTTKPNRGKVNQDIDSFISNLSKSASSHSEAAPAMSESSKDSSALKFDVDSYLDEQSLSDEIRTLDVDLPRRRGLDLSAIFSEPLAQLGVAFGSGKMRLIVSVFVGVVIGWTAHNGFNAFANSSIPDVAQSAIDAHVFYTSESKHVVEVSVKDNRQLRNWVKSSLDAELEPVNLKKYDFELLGGRVLPVKGKLAGQYVYRNKKRNSHLTIFMSNYLRGINNASPACDQIETTSGKLLGICGWIKADLVFYVIANMSTGDINKVAVRVKELMPKG